MGINNPWGELVVCHIPKPSKFFENVCKLGCVLVGVFMIAIALWGSPKEVGYKKSIQKPNDTEVLYGRKFP